MSDQVKRNSDDQTAALLQEGCAVYLDALYALHRFRREVTDAAISVWNDRLDQLTKKIGIEGPRPEHSVRYCNPDGVSSDCNGNWAWITCRSWFPEPWSGNCHLGLRFRRDIDGILASPDVIFLSNNNRNAVIFSQICAAFEKGNNFWRENTPRECGFSWPLTKNLTLREQFNTMMDHVITNFTETSGLRNLPKPLREGGQ